MQRDLKVLWRCMGGRFCNHTPGTCTATVGRHAPEPEGRRMSDELVEAVARKLCGTRFLNGGIEDDDGWDSCPKERRAEYLAFARAAIAVVIGRVERELDKCGEPCSVCRDAIRKLGERE